VWRKATLIFFLLCCFESRQRMIGAIYMSLLKTALVKKNHSLVEIIQRDCSWSRPCLWNYALFKASQEAWYLLPVGMN
jgi:hypothetical protein